MLKVFGCGMGGEVMGLVVFRVWGVTLHASSRVIRRFGELKSAGMSRRDRQDSGTAVRALRLPRLLYLSSTLSTTINSQIADSLP